MGRVLSKKEQGSHNSFDAFYFLQKYGSLLLFFTLIIANVLFTNNFLKLSSLWNMLLQVFPVMLISMGITLVIATGGIDISVGSTMALVSMVVTKLIIQQNMSIAPAIVIAITIGLSYGMFNGFFISKFKIQPIIVTLILMIAGRGIAQVLNNGVIISFYNNDFANLGVYRIGGVVPVQTVIMLIVITATYFIVSKTVLGVYIEAVGDNKNAAVLSGINEVLTIIFVYVFCSLLVGVASVFETSRLCSADPNNIGKLIELDCIAAVAVGGTKMTGGKSKVIGTVIGALIMQLITTTINMNNIQYEFSLVIKSLLIVSVLYIQKEKGRR